MTIIGTKSCAKAFTRVFLQRHRAAPGSGRTWAWRCSSVLHIWLMLRPRPWCRRLAVRTRGSSGRIGRRPPLRPRALAAASPARVRSWIRRRSNCARLEKMLNINSPDAVVVSMAPSESDRKPIPLPSNSSTRATRCGIERPRRSRRQTTKVSPASKALTHASSPGRLPRAPDVLSV